jgi:hypothetical protein
LVSAHVRSFPTSGTRALESLQHSCDFAGVGSAGRKHNLADRVSDDPASERAEEGSAQCGLVVELVDPAGAGKNCPGSASMAAIASGSLIGPE